MYKPKKHIRLDAIRGLPKMSNMRSLLAEARGTKGCTVELPWRSNKTDMSYSMTVRVELGGQEPIWTLYEGEGSSSRVMWSSPFEDLDLLYDVVCLSLPADVSTALVPDEIAIAPSPYKTSREPEPMPAMPPRPDLTEDPLFFSKPQEESEFPKFPKPVDAEPGLAPPPPQPEPVAAPAAAPAQQAPANQPYPPQPYPQPGYPPPGYGYPPPPGYPQPPYPYPPAYAYPPAYPPGYGYPPGYMQPPYPYPPPYPPPAQTVPMQPGVPYSPPLGDIPPAPQGIDADLLKKRPNVLLGSFLVEAGLIPETTLKSALQLQEMVKTGSLTTKQAAEAVRRAHTRGGALEPNLFSATPPNGDVDAKAVAPPLGQILVEAGLISIAVLKAALNLQEVVRNGAMSKESAVESFITEHFGKAGKHGTSEPPEAVKAMDLIKSAGLLQQQDFQAAVNVKVRHGGEVAKILAAAGKLDSNTFDAALTCIKLMEENRLKMEQAMIALHYCQRSRATFNDAVEELGWEKP